MISIISHELFNVLKFYKSRLCNLYHNLGTINNQKTLKTCADKYSSLNVPLGLRAPNKAVTITLNLLQVLRRHEHLLFD